MNWPIAVSLVVIVITLMLLILLFRRGGRPGKIVYQKNLTLFSPEERILHGVLVQAVGDEFEVFGKIRVADIIQPKKGAPAGRARNSYEDLAESLFAFVLCNRKDLSVSCAVQLHDRGHAGKRPAGHEHALRVLCEAARLPLVCVKASPFYEVAEVRETVLGALRDEPFLLPQLDGRREPRFSSIDNLDLE